LTRPCCSAQPAEFLNPTPLVTVVVPSDILQTSSRFTATSKSLINDSETGSVRTLVSARTLLGQARVTALTRVASPTRSPNAR
jgi:hypothetical protein